MNDPRYPYALPVGTEVAGQRILGVLGAGDLGITYKAFDEAAHRTVALREFFVRDRCRRDGTAVGCDAPGWRAALELFCAEATLVVGRFGHPALLKGEKLVEANGTAYLAADYAEGIDLERWLAARTEPPDEAELSTLFAPVLDAVAHIHAGGAAHGNLTARNLLVRPDGAPLLIDFGTAGRALLSPAGAAAAATGPAADIRALGALLHQAIAGAPPQPGRSARDATPRPERYGAALFAGIDRALAPDPAARPPTVAALRLALGWPAPAAPPAPAPAAEPVAAEAAPAEAAIAAAPVAAVPPPVPASRRRIAAGPIAAAVAALVVLAGLIWTLAGPGPGPTPAPAVYGLLASRDGAAIRLAGTVPGEAERQAFAAAAARAAPGARIDDALRVAPGAPAGYAEAVGRALAGLGPLAAGTLRVEGRDITLEGTAASPESYALLPRAGAALPAGWTLTVSVRPAAVEAFAFRIALEPGRVAVAGYVPDEATRARILDAARRAAAGRTVHDETRIAAGADPAFAELAVFAAGRLADLSLGRLEIAGRELTIEGRALSPEAYAALKAATAPAGRLTTAIRPPLVQPFELAVAVGPDRIGLAGSVPSDEVKAALAAAAARIAAGRPVEDETRLADGAPADFAEAARALIALAPHLATGRLVLSGRSVTVDGAIADPPAYMALTRALAAPSGDGLPAGFVVDRNTVAPPHIAPYRWAAVREGGTVRLTGFVPSDAVRQEIVQAARAALGRGPVEDAMLIGEGAPAGFAALARLGLAQLPRLAVGGVALDDGTLAFDGTAADPETYAAALRDLARPLPAGGTLRLDGLRPATVAPFLWSAELGQGRIRLTGYVPDEATRTALAEAARRLAPRAALNDRTLVAAGAPDGFSAAALYALERLQDVGIGKAVLGPDGLGLDGRARSFDAYDAAVRRNGEPAPVPLNAAIRPPVAAPFEFAVAAGPDGLHLTGVVPSAEAKAELVRIATEAAGDRPVGDATRVADGAPAGFLAAAHAAAEAAGRLGEGRASLRDQAVTVEGQAVGSDDYEALRKTAAALPPGFRLTRLAVEPPLIAPYDWSATVEAGAVRLAGHVPGDAARRAIVQAAAAQFGAGAVRDEMAAGSGAPERFEAMARYALAQAARLARGRVALEDGVLALDGVAATPDAHAALLRDLGRPAAGATIGPVALTPATVAPFTWGVRIERRAIRLSGYVPGEAERRQIAEGLRAALPGLELRDETRIAAGAGPGFVTAALFAADRAAELAEGSVAISDNAMKVTGIARDADSYRRFSDAIEDPALPSGISLAHDVAAPRGEEPARVPAAGRTGHEPPPAPAAPLPAQPSR